MKTTPIHPILHKINSGYEPIEGFGEIKFTDFKQQNGEGLNAFMVYFSKNINTLNEQEIDYLIEQTDFSVQDCDGDTAILYACMSDFNFTEKQWNHMIDHSDLLYQSHYWNFTLAFFFEENNLIDKIGFEAKIKILNKLISIEPSYLETMIKDKYEKKYLEEGIHQFNKMLEMRQNHFKNFFAESTSSINIKI